MSVAIVTGYVPIPDHPRSEYQYMQSMDRLTRLPFPKAAYNEYLEDCWLHRYLELRGDVPFKVGHAVADNPQKNSRAFHVVQAQKSEWIARAAEDTIADVLVWIDAGIFHLPDVTEEIISDFLDRVNNGNWTNLFAGVTAPGCWEQPWGGQRNDPLPDWHFCGGVLIVPRRLAMPLDIAMKYEYLIDCEVIGSIEWEVNVLSRVETTQNGVPVRWYQADHNSSMFLNYRPGEEQCVKIYRRLSA